MNSTALWKAVAILGWTLLFFSSLPGCAQIALWNDRVEAVTDALVARGGGAADKLMDGADKLEALLVAKLGRVRAARCLNTLPSIRRYALKSNENHAVILRDCHLDVRGTDVLMSNDAMGADLISAE